MSRAPRFEHSLLLAAVAGALFHCHERAAPASTTPASPTDHRDTPAGQPAATPGGPCQYEQVVTECRLVGVTPVASPVAGEERIALTYRVERTTPPLPPQPQYTEYVRLSPGDLARARAHFEAHPLVRCEYQALTSGSCGSYPASIFMPPLPPR